MIFRIILLVIFFSPRAFGNEATFHQIKIVSDVSGGIELQSVSSFGASIYPESFIYALFQKYTINGIQLNYFYKKNIQLKSFTDSDKNNILLKIKIPRQQTGQWSKIKEALDIAYQEIAAILKKQYQDFHCKIVYSGISAKFAQKHRLKTSIGKPQTLKNITRGAPEKRGLIYVDFDGLKSFQTHIMAQKTVGQLEFYDPKNKDKNCRVSGLITEGESNASSLLEIPENCTFNFTAKDDVLTFRQAKKSKDCTNPCMVQSKFTGTYLGTTKTCTPKSFHRVKRSFLRVMKNKKYREALATLEIIEPCVSVVSNFEKSWLYNDFALVFSNLGQRKRCVEYLNLVKDLKWYKDYQQDKENLFFYGENEFRPIVRQLNKLEKKCGKA